MMEITIDDAKGFYKSFYCTIIGLPIIISTASFYRFLVLDLGKALLWLVVDNLIYKFIC